MATISTSSSTSNTLSNTRTTQHIDGKALLSADEAAVFYSVSPTTIKRLGDANKIARVKIGSLCRYPVEDLVRYFRSLR